MNGAACAQVLAAGGCDDRSAAVAARGLCAGLEKGEAWGGGSCLVASTLARCGGREKVAVLRALLRVDGAEAARRLVACAKDPDLKVRAKAHAALASCNYGAREVARVALWQLGQESCPKELFAAARDSLENAVGFIDDISDFELPAPCRGRCAALQAFLRRGLLETPEVVAAAVLEGLASSDAGAQRAAAALGAAQPDDGIIATVLANGKTRDAAAARLAPLLGKQRFRDAADLIPNAAARARAKLAAGGLSDAELEAALVDGDVGVRAAALLAVDDARFPAAARAAVVRDAVLMPRDAIATRARKTTTTSSLNELCAIALEGLRGGDAQQLAAAELLAGISSFPPPRCLVVDDLVRVLVSSTWDRVRSVVAKALEETIVGRGAPLALAAGRRLEDLFCGPSFHSRDAGAKLARILERRAAEGRSSSRLVPDVFCLDVRCSPAAPGALLALAELGELVEDRDLVLEMARRALKATARLLPRDDGDDDDDDDAFTSERRGLHLCRAACACVRVHAAHAEAAAVACGDALLEDVLLTTRHSGAIAVAASALEVLVEGARARWLDACVACCLDHTSTRCSLRRSNGLASAIVALVDRDPSSLALRLLEESSSRRVSATRALHCVAAILWQRADRVPPPLYARVLATALSWADAEDWGVRSAAALAISAVSRRPSSDAAVREIFSSAVLRPGAGPMALFSSLSALARLGSDASNSSRLAEAIARALLGHPSLPIRDAAAKAVASLARGDEVRATRFVLECGGGNNALHGVLLAAKRLVVPATARTIGSFALRVLRREDAAPPLVRLEAHAAASAAVDDKSLAPCLFAAIDDLESAALENTALRQQPDAAPGASLVRARLCAAAIARRLPCRDDERRRKALSPLASPDDDAAVAVARAATAFLETEDFVEEEDDASFGRPLVFPKASAEIPEVLERASAAAVVEYCLSSTSSPARRGAVLRLAARSASLRRERRPARLLLERCPGWSPDHRALALELAAAWDPVAAAPLAPRVKSALEDSLPVLRRAAARALTLAPDLLNRDDVFAGLVRLAEGPDAPAQILAARALCAYCGSPLVAPYVAVRRALHFRGNSELLEGLLQRP
ncbi:hypothetical protein CTAYLR_005847 [Chrysophaeum taylorii]|uniref:DUF2428 domain-containing protein n=1 Tax=Chrysophaeum taylorii TaxID=2483200 RepID=A0AAD7UR46_9STRA|nr:hypothetical protein CTAYLR_005847 [Chrysophaeum taylorii]